MSGADGAGLATAPPPPAGAGAGAPPAPAGATVSGTPPLRNGARGPAVSALQAALTTHNVDPKGTNGKFGDNTEAAVRAFQHRSKIGIDGVVGPTTASALNAGPAAAPAAPAWAADPAGPAVATPAPAVVAPAPAVTAPAPAVAAPAPAVAAPAPAVAAPAPAVAAPAPVVASPAPGVSTPAPAVAPPAISAMPRANDPIVPSADPLRVPRGQLTFEVEGLENPGGRFHSRVAEWPGGASGVTIGRGYDVGQRSRAEVIGHMTAAGIPEATANAYAAATGFTGRDARDYLREHRSELPGITLEQQNALFQISYNQLAADVVRISDNYATTLGERDPKKDKEDFEIDWERINPAIRDMVVDLRFRGDYTQRSRKRVQPAAIANDLPGLLAVIRDRSFWTNVPQDRFDRRVAFLQAAVAGGAQPSLTGNGPVPASQQQPGVSNQPASGAALQTGATGGERGRTAPTPEATAPATGENIRSGANWVGIANSNGWANSTDFSTFDSAWGPKARSFVEGLRSNGASVEVTAGLRHPNRAALMHYAWHVGAGTKTAAAANADCRARGINIEWDHGTAAATRTAANALKNAFGLVMAASLTSNHIRGLAMDIKITNVPSSLTMNGQTYNAQRKGNGTLDEDKVDHIGAAMGVNWFGSGDWVHWSVDGH